MHDSYIISKFIEIVKSFFLFFNKNSLVLSLNLCYNKVSISKGASYEKRNLDDREDKA